MAIADKVYDDAVQAMATYLAAAVKEDGLDSVEYYAELVKTDIIRLTKEKLA